MSSKQTWFIAAAFLIGLMGGCAGKRNPTVVNARAGDFIAGYGFSIDADHDPKLNSLLPGYKLLTVAIRNTSLNVIRMDAQKDRWVVVNANGQKLKGINNLRARDRKQWDLLPQRMKELVEYPDVIPISYTATFDLFFPKKTLLDGLREIRYHNAATGLEFRMQKED